MAYKTFEDMKHNMPEGATHYQNETKEFSFAWFNVDEDKCYVDGEWWPYSLDGYPMDEIKPIPPTIKTESPEEREALDMIDATSKQVESLAKGDVVEWNGEGLPPIGVECEFKKYYEDKSEFVKCFIAGETKDKEWLVVHDYEDDELHLANKRTRSFEFRPIETPEQKAERERLEAAIDLHDTFNAKYCEGNSAVLGELGWDSCPDHVRDCYLAIVDKTGYRKAK